jgi:hypothetical protein
VKNEEASAVSRLNDEIRALKEKLAQSVHTGTEEGGTGVVSEKNKQQLRELEEAVRNTWEAKTKMSKEHEEERQRLLQEQQMAAQQLQNAKERSWLLLEQKALVELTLSHIRELSKGSSFLSPSLDNWTEALARVSTLEKSILELHTVIQVFRSSIEKDSINIAKVITLSELFTFGLLLNSDLLNSWFKQMVNVTKCIFPMRLLLCGKKPRHCLTNCHSGRHSNIRWTILCTPFWRVFGRFQYRSKHR